MKRLLMWILVVASAGACTSRSAVDQPLPGVTPALTVERFLQATNALDFVTMSRLFGTEDGPIGDRRRRTNVELQMNALAEILRHNDYEIISERSVAGAESPSRRVGVDMDISTPAGTMRVRDVGFTVVLESPDRWLINNIEVNKITDGP